MKDPNLCTNSNSPQHPIFYDTSCFKYALPCIRSLGASCIKNQPWGEIFCTKHFVEQWCFFCLQPPHLFRQHGLIESNQILEAHPSPDFGLHNVSQLFQWIFLWPPHSPHQNFLICISILLHKPTGNLKQLIAKVGMAWTTAFRNTSLPT